MKFIFNNKEYPSIDGVKKAYYGIPVPPGPDYTEPFYVENINSGIETLNIKKSGSFAPTLTIEYSTNRVNWNTLGTTSTTDLTYTLNPGDKVYLRCDTTSWGYRSGSSHSNRISGVSKVGGNIMSLLYGSSFTGDENIFRNTSNQAFYGIFEANSTLKDAQYLLLPATTLTFGCYREMFRSCTSLTTIPILPVATLADYCYASMFLACSALTTPPELPATTLVSGCYSDMFNSCTSLTNAPDLLATTLVDYCYYEMFYNCKNLKYIKCLATDISASKCTYNWMQRVPTLSGSTFVKKAGVEWPTSPSGIPERWTVVEE